MRLRLPASVRWVLHRVAAVAVLGSLFGGAFALGSRSLSSPMVIEILGYDGPRWVVVAVATGIFVAGFLLEHLLNRLEADAD